MKNRLLFTALMAVASMGFASNALATELADGVFNGQYPGNTTSCFVCHTGRPGGFTLYGNAYVAAGGSKNGTASAMTTIEGIDVDSDGFTNLQEINGKSDPILAGSTPYTVSTNAMAAGSGLVKYNATATATSATYTGTFVAPTGAILNNLVVSVTVGVPGTDAITLLFAGGGADANAKVYTRTGTMVTGSTVGNDGSITFPVAANPTEIVVVSTAPATTYTAPAGSGGSSGGCSIGTSTTFDPTMIVLFLLSIAFLMRKGKQSN